MEKLRHSGHSNKRPLFQSKRRPFGGRRACARRGAVVTANVQLLGQGFSPKSGPGRRFWRSRMQQIGQNFGGGSERKNWRTFGLTVVVWWAGGLAGNSTSYEYLVELSAGCADGSVEATGCLVLRCTCSYSGPSVSWWLRRCSGVRRMYLSHVQGMYSNLVPAQVLAPLRICGVVGAGWVAFVQGLAAIHRPVSGQARAHRRAL